MRVDARPHQDRLDGRGVQCQGIDDGHRAGVEGRGEFSQRFRSGCCRKPACSVRRPTQHGDQIGLNPPGHRRHRQVRARCEIDAVGLDVTRLRLGGEPVRGDLCRPAVGVDRCCGPLVRRHGEDRPAGATDDAKPVDRLDLRHQRVPRGGEIGDEAGESVAAEMAGDGPRGCGAGRGPGTEQRRIHDRIAGPVRGSEESCAMPVTIGVQQNRCALGGVAVLVEISGQAGDAGRRQVPRRDLAGPPGESEPAEAGVDVERKSVSQCERPDLGDRIHCARRIVRCRSDQQYGPVVDAVGHRRR